MIWHVAFAINALAAASGVSSGNYGFATLNALIAIYSALHSIESFKPSKVRA